MCINCVRKSRQQEYEQEQDGRSKMATTWHEHGTNMARRWLPYSVPTIQCWWNWLFRHPCASQTDRQEARGAAGCSGGWVWYVIGASQRRKETLSRPSMYAFCRFGYLRWQHEIPRTARSFDEIWPCEISRRDSSGKDISMWCDAEKHEMWKIVEQETRFSFPQSVDTVL